MKIGAAYAAKRDANQDFPTCRLRSGTLLKSQRVGFDRGGYMEDAGFQGRDPPLYTPVAIERARKRLKMGGIARRRCAKKCVIV